MQAWSRWILGTALAADIVFVLFVVAGRWTPTWARAGESDLEHAAPEQAPADATSNEWSAAALESLGQQLMRRTEELAEREAELEEARRASEVLRRAGLLEPEAESAAGGPGAEVVPVATPKPAADPTSIAAVASSAFLRLQKAYENMEPDSAARALEQLARKDQQAVVQLLLGWQPRVSGAILDALTQTNPILAADLSYEIWTLSGKPGT